MQEGRLYPTLPPREKYGPIKDVSASTLLSQKKQTQAYSIQQHSMNC